MKKFALLLVIFSSLFAMAQQRVSVTITNITKGQIISPPIAVAHNSDIQLFELGQPASASLAALAEDGMAGPLAEELMGHDLVGDVAVAEGPLMPGASVTLELEVNAYTSRISVAGMLVTTNDAFFAVSSVQAPIFYFKNGNHGNSTYYGTVFDAGSEANSETCATIPGPPCGNGGVRDTEGAEGYVYIHNGIHGIGDIAPETYSWDGPATMVKIERMN